jgi:predicted permease
MSTEMKFLLFQGVIILPLLFGTFLKKRFENPEKQAKRIININIFLFQPLIILWSVWGMKMQEGLIYLPMAGTALVAAGFLLGIILVPFTGLTGKSRTTFIISSSLANHGFTMGSFLCYLIAGERGLSLAMVFLVYFIPYTFGFIFPYARLSSTGEGYSWDSLKDSLFAVQNIPLYTVLVALILNFLDIGRPDVSFPIDFLLMVSIALYYFTLGINFTFRGTGFFSREQIILLASKFIVLPGAVFLILIPVELSPGIEMVIKVQSFMPAAIYSVISAILFDLDSYLATRLFVVNTLFFVLLVLPLLIFFKDYIL